MDYLTLYLTLSFISKPHLLFSQIKLNRVNFLKIYDVIIFGITLCTYKCNTTQRVFVRTTSPKREVFQQHNLSIWVTPNNSFRLGLFVYMSICF